MRGSRDGGIDHVIGWVELRAEQASPAFRRTHAVEPSLRWKPHPKFLTNVFLRYDDRSFFPSTSNDLELDRDGPIMADICSGGTPEEAFTATTARTSQHSAQGRALGRAMLPP